jgi:hypothetical protein
MLRINAGYVITDSIHVGDSEFVLGVSQYIPNDYVTWKCKDGTNYFWGHYHSDPIKAVKDLVSRAMEEIQALEEQRFTPPTESPWGEVQTCKELVTGAYSVSTASHGGIMAVVEEAEELFSPDARACGFVEGRYLCFEEDCDAQVVILELMDRKLYQVPVNEHYPPGKYESMIDANVQRNHPEYWAFRKRHLLPALQNKHNNSNKERER